MGEDQADGILREIIERRTLGSNISGERVIFLYMRFMRGL